MPQDKRTFWALCQKWGKPGLDGQFMPDGYSLHAGQPQLQSFITSYLSGYRTSRSPQAYSLPDGPAYGCFIDEQHNQQLLSRGGSYRYSDNNYPVSGEADDLVLIGLNLLGYRTAPIPDPLP